MLLSYQRACETEDQALRIVQHNPYWLRDLPLVYRTPIVVMTALKGSSLAARYSPQSYFEDYDFALQALTIGCRILSYLSSSLRANRQLVKLAVGQHGDDLLAADKKFWVDREIVMIAVQTTDFWPVLGLASPGLRADREIVMLAVGHDGQNLQYADPTLRQDREVVLAAITNNPLALRYADPALRGDRALVSLAVRANPKALFCATDQLLLDKEVVMLAVAQQPELLGELPTSLRQDSDVLLATLSRQSKVILCIPDQLFLRPKFVLKAVRRNGRIMNYLKLSPEIVAYLACYGLITRPLTEEEESALQRVKPEIIVTHFSLGDKPWLGGDRLTDLEIRF